MTVEFLIDESDAAEGDYVPLPAEIVFGGHRGVGYGDRRGWKMRDSWRRVCVHADAAPFGVDLSLPAAVPVGALLPQVCEIVAAAAPPAPTAADLPRRWRLCVVGGGSLDESMTLADNDVHDGDILVLSAVPPPAPHRTSTLPELVAGPEPPPGPGARRLAAAVSLWTWVVGAAALCWTRPPQPGGETAVAAALAIAAVLTAAAGRRAGADPQLCLAAGVVAVVFAAVCGFLAVPADPIAAGSLLAAAAAAATGTLVIRVVNSSTPYLIALPTLSALAMPAAAAAVLWSLPAQGAGAVLMVTAVGALGAAGRVAILLAGLTDDEGPDTDQEDHRRVRLGRAVLTGLVAGASGAAVLAAVLIATGQLTSGPWQTGATLTVVAAAAMLLRARHYGDPWCRVILLAAGISVLTITFALFVNRVPDSAGWLTVAAALAATTGLVPAASLSAQARRALDMLEYLAAAAAVVPAAVWVLDVYGAVRTWHLA